MRKNGVDPFYVLAVAALVAGVAIALLVLHETRADSGCTAGLPCDPSPDAGTLTGAQLLVLGSTFVVAAVLALVGFFRQMR